MSNSGTTIVSIRKTDATTRVKHIPVYSLDYVAGDARPHISLQSTNENYLLKADLEAGKTYICNWEQIGVNVNPNTGEETPKFAMRFEICDTSDPLAWAISLRKFRDAFGDNKEVEAKQRAKFRKNTGEVETQQQEQEVPVGNLDDAWGN